MVGVNIQQYGSRGFDDTFAAADASHGAYEVQRNNWWANKSRILDARRLNNGDILTFSGTAPCERSRDGNGVHRRNRGGGCWAIRSSVGVN